MGPDPFNMPGAGAAGNAKALNDFVGQAAPYAQVWHGPITGPSVPTLPPVASQSSSGSNISKFTHFLGGVGSEIGHIAGGAASWLATQVKNSAVDVWRVGEGVANIKSDSTNLTSINARNNQISAQMDSLNSQFKAGRISAQEYKNGLKELNQDANNLINETKATNTRLSSDAKMTTLATIDTAATLVTILTMGAGAAEGKAAELTAAKFLTSSAADGSLSTAEKNIGKLAVNSELFAKLTPEAQKAIQTATAEVVSSTAKMTSGQMARATAVNLALKYPIYYNFLSSTAKDIYNDLDKKEYGSAVRTLAFNAALLLSGGPIGQALKYGGKTVSGVVSKTFGRTAFLDELSKGIGNGDPAGLFNAINKLPADERADVIKQLSSVEATNVGAVGGKDATAAAIRVLRGMESYEGISMSQFTHEEALNNMVNFAKAQRMADEAGKLAGLGPVTVGRIDSRALDTVGQIALSEGSADRLKAWEALKQANPTQAWANNENFDRQIKSLINKYENPAELQAAISRIKASFVVDGFPKSVAKQLSKMGYIPIKPVNLEAPFKEGADKLASKFAKNDDFFVKAVQPLPILGHLGSLLTNMGLSPYASTQRVYQIFNDNLAKNLQESGVIKKIAGEDAKDSTDTLIKQLSDYAHNPTRGKIVSKMPITDLRMLTVGDIKVALGVSTSEAKLVQKSIAQAFIQVPMAVRGLGDRAVDAAYRIPGVSGVTKRYLRVQGAARFSWNPFFQYLRVVPKTETLASFEGGGFIKSVFAGRGKVIKEIRAGLREAGALDEKGRLGDVVSGEAVDFAGSMSKNLTKKLLPMQERSIAGLIDAQARRMGVDWQTYIKENPQAVRDTIQMIAEYDRRADFLNSPLMRTMNIAFFPMRFDVKVATIMARSLARTSLMTQVSVVNGLLQAHDWLNSPEGQAWYSKNADVIGLINYVTPVAHLNEVFQSLIPGHDHSLGNFGELGGLPFGWIPQLLDAEGLTHFNQPGVNAKTGAIYKDYIPVTARGQLATAIQDFLSSLFSYPGATVGLPSKTKVTLGIGEGLTGANKQDFQANQPVISGDQKNYSDLIQQLSATPPQHPNPLPQQPMRPSTNVNNPPPTFAPTRVPGSGSTRGRKKKKAEYTPGLLPGQTTLGQL